MIEKFVYDSDKLLEKLGKKYSLQKIKHVVHYSEEYDDCGTKTYHDYFITTIPNIDKIETSYSCFVSDRKVILNDGTKLHLSTAIYQGRKDVGSMRENNTISDYLKVRGRFIEVDDDLDNWLKKNGITAKELKSFRISVIEEETYRFPFADIIFEPETGEISGKNYTKKLTIQEKELAKALSEIEDKKTAYKIQYILEHVNKLKVYMKD